jgi:hypothetical protein
MNGFPIKIHQLHLTARITIPLRRGRVLNRVTDGFVDLALSIGLASTVHITWAGGVCFSG